VSKKIFIVDDDRGILEMLRDNLEKARFEVLAEADSRVASERISSEIPGAVILDLVMPEPDGFEVLKSLKSNDKTKNIPVIILTTHDTKENRDRCAELGAAKYMLKPVNIKKLIEAIK